MYARKATVDAAGDVDQTLQGGSVSESGRIVQGQHLDRQLTGLVGQFSGIGRHRDGAADVALRRGKPCFGDAQLRVEPRHHAHQGGFVVRR